MIQNLRVIQYLVAEQDAHQIWEDFFEHLRLLWGLFTVPDIDDIETDYDVVLREGGMTASDESGAVAAFSAREVEE